MLGANHQHVAAVAVGHHLLLQILRVPSAQKPVERRPQALLLFAQTLANRGERGARVVGDLARRLDLAPHVGDLLFERRDRFHQHAQQRKCGPDLRDRLTRLLDRLEISGQSEQPHRLEPTALDAECVDDLAEIRRRPQRESRIVGQEARALGGCPLRREDLRRGRQRMEIDQPIAAE